MKRAFQHRLFQRLEEASRLKLIRDCLALGCASDTMDLIETIGYENSLLDEVSPEDLNGLFAAVSLSKDVSVPEHLRFDLAKPLYLSCLRDFLEFLPKESRLPAILKIFEENDLIKKDKKWLSERNLEELILNALKFKERKRILRVLYENIPMASVFCFNKALLNIMECSRGTADFLDFIRGLRIPDVSGPSSQCAERDPIEWFSRNTDHPALLGRVHRLPVIGFLVGLKLSDFDRFLEEEESLDD